MVDQEGGPSSPPPINAPRKPGPGPRPFYSSSPALPVDNNVAGVPLVTEDGTRLVTETGQTIIASPPVSTTHTLIAETGSFNVQGNEANFRISRPRRATVVGRAVQRNEPAIQLAAISLLTGLDAKLDAIRGERSNSEDPAEIENLRRLVAEFLAALAESKEPPIVETTTSFAQGLRRYWDKEHVTICGRALNMSLFACGLSLCAMAGALGPVGVVTVGALVGGKDVTDALTAWAKSLPRSDDK